MAGANNKSAKKYGYTQKQIQTERAKGGVLSLASLMSRVEPARPTKAYLARKDGEGNTAPLRKSGFSKEAVAKVRADMSARTKAMSESRSPRVTWGEKVAAARGGTGAPKANTAPLRRSGFSTADIAKVRANQRGADAFSVANLMKRSEGAQSSGPKFPKHVSQVGQGSFAHPKNTVRENRLHWAATKAKETGKQAYVVADTSRHATQSGGLKLTYKQPKRGKYMAVSPSGAISYHS